MKVNAFETIEVNIKNDRDETVSFESGQSIVSFPYIRGDLVEKGFGENIHLITSITSSNIIDFNRQVWRALIRSRKLHT